MLSHRDQFCTCRVTLGGVIMLSFMLLFNLSTSLAQWCDSNVEDVQLIGLTADHLVVITGGSAGACSYYLPTDSLDTENMQIHLNGGLLLSERWPKFYEKFDPTNNGMVGTPGGFTVRDVSGRNIIVFGSYAYDIDKDTLHELSFMRVVSYNKVISSTKNMKYHAIKGIKSRYRNDGGAVRHKYTPYGIYEYQISSPVIYEASSLLENATAFMCSDFSNENIYLHSAPSDDRYYYNSEDSYNKHCLTCVQNLSLKDFGPSGFTDGNRFYLFSKNLVNILNTPDLMDPKEKICVVREINVTSKELSAFFIKPPPPDPTTQATTPTTTLSTPKRNWSTLPYDPNSNPAKSGSSSSRTGLIIGIVLIVILFVGALCVCGCCCYKKKKKQPKNADKNTKTDAGRGRIKTRGRSAEKLGANSRGKQGHKASSLKRSSLASVRKTSSRKNLSSKRATSLAVASKKTGKPSSMRNDKLATSRQASSLRPSSRKNLSSKRATSLAVASKKTGKPSSMRNDNLATSRRASSNKNLSSKRVSTQAVTSRRTGRSARTKQSLASRK